MIMRHCPPQKKRTQHRLPSREAVHNDKYLHIFKSFQGGKETNEMNVGRGMLMWLCCCPNVSVRSRKGAASTCRDASLARDGRGIAN